MARGKGMKAFEQVLREKQAHRDRLNIEIVALEEAIRRASGAEPAPKRRAPRSNVKDLVLRLLQEVGSDGLNAAKAVQLAEERGMVIERGTVSSLLSRLKNEGTVTYDNVAYRLASPAGPDSGGSEPNDSAKVFDLRSSKGAA
jgi:hypothetical protein